MPSALQVATFFAVVALPVTTSSQARPAAPAYVRVAGVLDADSGGPIEGAELTDMLARRAVLSSALGVAPLVFADTGSSIIEVRKVGYVPTVLLVRHSAQDTVPVTIALHRLSAQTLPTVTVTDSSPHYISPALRGFEERRHEGMGRFITEAELRSSEHRKLADVLQSRVPGIVILRGRGSNILASPRGTSLVAPRGSGSVAGSVCYPDVFLDGVRVGRGGAGVNLDDFAVSDLGAVEFHNIATVPVQFNATGAGCGVLLLWTRER